jgi:hypothetical protein
VKPEPLHAGDLVRGIITVFPLNAHSVINAYIMSPVPTVDPPAACHTLNIAIPYDNQLVVAIRVASFSGLSLTDGAPPWIHSLVVSVET